MTVLDMDAATLPADAKALYETMAARRKTKGKASAGLTSRCSTIPSLRAASRSLGSF
jgi:hypothetical protein